MGHAIFEDDFTGYTGNLELQATWIKQAGDTSAESDGTLCTGGVKSNYSWVGQGIHATSHFAQVDIPAAGAGNTWGPGVRLQAGADSGYGVLLLGPGGLNPWSYFIMRVTAGVAMLLGPPVISQPPEPFSIRLIAIGVQLVLQRFVPAVDTDWVTSAVVSDGTYASGLIGLISAQAAATDYTITKWRGGAIAGPYEFDRRALWLGGAARRYDHRVGVEAIVI